jgi:hypothetical protein
VSGPQRELSPARTADPAAEHERLCRVTCRALDLDPNALQPGHRHTKNWESTLVRQHVKLFLALSRATRAAP